MPPHVVILVLKENAVATGYDRIGLPMICPRSGRIAYDLADTQERRGARVVADSLHSQREGQRLPLGRNTDHAREGYQRNGLAERKLDLDCRTWFERHVGLAQSPCVIEYED